MTGIGFTDLFSRQDYAGSSPAGDTKRETPEPEWEIWFYPQTTGILFLGSRVLVFIYSSLAESGLRRKVATFVSAARCSVGSNPTATAKH